MIFSGFDILKFVKGFAFWKGEVLGKIIYFVIIALVVWLVLWKLFIKTENTSHMKQKASQITNNTINEQPEKRHFFQINLL